MSPVGAIFVPFPPKTGGKLLHPRPSPIVERVPWVWSERTPGHPVRLLSRLLLLIVVLVRCFSVQDAGFYTWPERVLLLDSITTVVPIGNSRSTSSREGVVSVFRERFQCTCDR